MPNFTYFVRTDTASAFTGALAQNAIATANINLPCALSGVNGNSRVRLTALTVQSDQNLAWEIWLFGNSNFQQTTLNNDYALGFWSFSDSMGVQIAGANQFYYYIDGLDVSYVDLNNTSALHLALVNRSTTSKNAGATGEIMIQLTFQIEGP